MVRHSPEPLLKDLLGERSDRPRYQQLYESLRAAILSGRLRPGEKLPSTRSMASYLSLSRSTVLNAVDLLLAEGYVEGRRGSGTFVSTSLPEQVGTVASERPPVSAAQSAAPPLSGFGQRAVAIGYANRAALPPRPLQPGVPDFADFPLDDWARMAARVIRNLSASRMSYGDSAGLPELREAIAVYLRHSRAVRCRPEQVVIVNGSQQALDLIARLFIDPGDTVAVEDPLYPGTAAACAAAGAFLRGVPVDAEGMAVERLAGMSPAPRLVCVTPSHQYPLGHTLTLRRRLELLEWAGSAGALVVEDDYDSEFRYTGNPLSSLQGLDEQGRVFYVGTFSKVLFPGLRVGYLVAPPEMAGPVVRARAINDRTAPVLEQLLLAEFLSSGRFGRHLRRMRMRYGERQAALVEAFRERCAQWGRIDPAPAGMHLVAHLAPEVSDRAVAKVAAERGLAVPALSGYCRERTDLNGLVLGYAGFDPTAIREAVERLAGVLESAPSPPQAGSSR